MTPKELIDRNLAFGAAYKLPLSVESYGQSVNDNRIVDAFGFDLAAGMYGQVAAAFVSAANESPLLARMLREALAALMQIRLGEGRFSQDPLQHACNTIEDLTGAANDALARINAIAKEAKE